MGSLALWNYQSKRRKTEFQIVEGNKKPLHYFCKVNLTIQKESVCVCEWVSGGRQELMWLVKDPWFHSLEVMNEIFYLLFFNLFFLWKQFPCKKKKKDWGVGCPFPEVLHSQSLVNRPNHPLHMTNFACFFSFQ